MFKKIFTLSSLKISMFIAFFTAIFMFYHESEKQTFQFLEDIEFKALDNMFIVRGRQPISDKVAIVAVDEKSMDALGIWPWPRSTIATIIDKLSKAGVKIIAFDAVFDYPDRNNTLELISSLEQKLEGDAFSPESFKRHRLRLKNHIDYMMKQQEENAKETAKKSKRSRKLKLDYKMPPHLREVSGLQAEFTKIEESISEIKNFLNEQKKVADNDLAFAKAVREAEERGTSIVLGYFFYATPNEVENLDKDLLKKNSELIAPSAINIFRTGADANFNMLVRPYGIRMNIPALAEATNNYGYFNQLPDNDGIFRKTPMFFYHIDDEKFYPAMALKTLSVYLNENISLEIGTPSLREEQTEQVRLMLGEKKIPVDDVGRFVVNYAGPQMTFNYYSVADILSGQITAETLKDKIVLFGVTAVGIYDIRHTPMDEMYPGVEIHANIIENILNDNYLLRPNWLRGLELLFVLLIGLILGLVLSHIKLQYGLAITIASSVGYVLLSYAVFFQNGFWLKLMLPIIEMYSIVLVVGVYRYMTEEREKGKVRAAFQYYMTPSVVSQVLQDPDKLKLGGERRDITVLFSDIRGFTTLSETLSPEGLSNFLNEYLTPMTDIVFEYDGTLDKYMGDAVMAFWGAPLHLPDHAARGCRAALRMIEKLDELNPIWLERKLPPIEIGIGLNTGPMSVGNMGSAIRFDYTVMGDNVNLGARLESINKSYKTHIIISQYTRDQALEEFETMLLDKVQVKGKTEPIFMYELLGEKGKTPEAFLQSKVLFEQGFHDYQNQKWDDAMQAFKTALEVNPKCGPAKVYMERVELLQKNPPGENLDGVWVMTSK